MNWPKVMGIAAGGLLPVPLLLALFSLRLGGTAPVPDDGRVSPVLSFEERMERVTYHRHCEKSSDCEPPMGCIIDARFYTHYCTDSQCVTDAQCPEGLVCRELPSVDDGPLVRFCIPLGLRKEGEGCIELAPDWRYACESGLLCSGGRRSWCGRACNMDDAASCPEGFFCANVKPAPLCLPTCEARGCPEGQQCIRHYNGVSQCAVVYGPPCQDSPCPEGRECRVETSTPHPGKAWSECVQRCGPDRPPCPDGFTCDRWHCLPGCDPQGPNTCPEGYRCQQGFKPVRPWVCRPDQ